MALDAYGVAMSLAPVCPLDGVGGPYSAADTGVYPDGNGDFWRLDFAASSSRSQQQDAVTVLASLKSYVAPQTTGLTPYKIPGSVTFSATLAIGMTMMPVTVLGLLRTDAPMIAYGTALPSGIDVRAVLPDSRKDDTLMIQVAVLSALTGSTTVPFTLVGVR